jgi:hypothetical protein
MIRIAICQAAFDAIAATMPFGSVGYENATDDKGERLILATARRDCQAQGDARRAGEQQRRDLADCEVGCVVRVY